MEETLIGIYYDMWADKANLKEEQKSVETTLRKKYREIKKYNMGIKRKMKFVLFLLSPKVFCCIHKLIHKL